MADYMALGYKLVKILLILTFWNWKWW
jgi:hypothetical protein